MNSQGRTWILDFLCCWHFALAWQQLKITSFWAPADWLSQSAGWRCYHLADPLPAPHTGSQDETEAAWALYAPSDGTAGALPPWWDYPHRLYPLINRTNAYDSLGESGHSGSQTTNLKWGIKASSHLLLEQQGLFYFYYSGETLESGWLRGFPVNQ